MKYQRNIIKGKKSFQGALKSGNMWYSLLVVNRAYMDMNNLKLSFLVLVLLKNRSEPLVTRLPFTLISCRCIPEAWLGSQIDTARNISPAEL